MADGVIGRAVTVSPSIQDGQNHWGYAGLTTEVSITAGRHMHPALSVLKSFYIFKLPLEAPFRRFGLGLVSFCSLQHPYTE